MNDEEIAQQVAKALLPLALGDWVVVRKGTLVPNYGGHSLIADVFGKVDGIDEDGPDTVFVILDAPYGPALATGFWFYEHQVERVYD